MIHPNLSPLPTFGRLGSSVPADLQVESVTQAWFSTFSQSIQTQDFSILEQLCLEDVLWRDMLALTWDFRTFSNLSLIRIFLKDVLPSVGIADMDLSKSVRPELHQVYDDLAWIQAFFTFNTRVGTCSGIVRLVPIKSGSWKAHNIYTNLEGLKGFPERVGALRDCSTIRRPFSGDQPRVNGFEHEEPAVVVVGAGQAGLMVAARLRCLGVPTLVLEKRKRVGDLWRERYETLCLQDWVYVQHFPYLPFPPTWPAFTPAARYADWIESYATIMDIDVWTSSEVTSITKTDGPRRWRVDVGRNGEHQIVRPQHVIIAYGFSADIPRVPNYPGSENFAGTIIHSSIFRSAKDFIGKKVLVVGASNSGHDVAHALCNEGVDVTLFQRSSTYVMSSTNGISTLYKRLFSENSPPIEVSDRISASFPYRFSYSLHKRVTKVIADLDKDLLDGLGKCGFRLNSGEDGTGILSLVTSRSGGYYIDVGASQLIIEGKIKLKNGCQIVDFQNSGVRFDDGSALEADAIICATGFGAIKGPIRELCGEDIANSVGDIWGLNDEMELKGLWRQCGVEGLWFMMGNIAMCRFYSKHLAIQIKAMEENLITERYIKRA